MIGLKLSGSNTPDTTSLDSILNFILTPGMSAEQKVLAIYNFCRLHTWHWPAPKEHSRQLHELEVVFDVFKQLNVYGYSYCFAIRALAEALYEAAGFEACSIGIGGHVMTEVYYEGKYHFLDHDQRGYCRLDDGTIAGVDDYLFGQAKELILTPENPELPFFPAGKRPLVPYEQKHVFTGYLLNRQVHFRQHNKYRLTHDMTISLHPGERFERTWESNGRWHLFPELIKENRNDGYVNLNKPPYDIHAELYDQAPSIDNGKPLHSGSGMWIYRPDLGPGKSDYKLGVYESENIESSGPGIRPLNNKEIGTAVFRIRTPYIITGWIPDIKQSDRINGAAVLSGRYYKSSDKDTIAIFLSVDNCKWQCAWRAELNGEKSFTIDVSPQITGQYSYYVKYELTTFENPSDAVLLEIGIDTACQLNPAVLPAVSAGENKMTIAQTPADEIFEEFIIYNDLEKHNQQVIKQHQLVLENNGYDMLRPEAAGLSGFVVYSCKAPASKKISWCNIGGIFRSHHFPEEALCEEYRIFYALNEPHNWQLLWEADLPPYLKHWCFEADRKLTLSEPADIVYLKYELRRSPSETAGAGLVGARFSWGCVTVDPPESTEQLFITHNWSEDGIKKSFTAKTAASGDQYQFTAGGSEIRNVSVVMEYNTGSEISGPHNLMLERPEYKSPTQLYNNEVAVMRRSLRNLTENPSAHTVRNILEQDKHPLVQELIVCALPAIGGDDALQLLKENIGNSRFAESCFLEGLYQDGVIKDLLPYLTAESIDFRRSAAEIAAKRGDPAIVGPLLEAMKQEQDPEILVAQGAAVISLGENPDNVLSAKYFTGFSPGRLLPIAKAILQVDFDRGYAIFVNALKDKNRFIRYKAARILADCSLPAVLPLLQDNLTDISCWVRRAAVAAFGRLGTVADLTALELAGNSESRYDVAAEFDWAVLAIKKREGSI